MDVPGVDAAEQRREEEEVEFVLGALPSFWHNAQTVLRDIGYQRAANDHGIGRRDDFRDHIRDIDDRSEEDHDSLAATAGGKQLSTAVADENEADEKVCRMCFSSENELGDDGSSLGRLIAPCHCDGSMRYVHDTCLDQWRRKSAATEAARVCGQCHARYRFRRRPYANLIAFVQASQMLRILICFTLVFSLSFVLGVAAFSTLRAIAGFEQTPLSFIRDAVLQQVRIENPIWNITIHKDKAHVDVWIPASAMHITESPSMPRIEQDVYERADLEVLARIRQQELHNPVYFKRVKRSVSSQGSNHTDVKLLRNKLWMGKDVSQELERLSRGLPLFPLDDWYTDAPRVQVRDLDSTPPAVEPMDETSSSVPLQTLSHTAPSLRQRLSNLSFFIKKREDEAAAESDEIEIWQRQNLTIYWEYEESPADFFPGPNELVLVRSLPEWLGFMRYVPYGILLGLLDRFYFVISVFRPWWSSIARSALQLTMLLLESHRELLWCASKAAVAGLIAYIDVTFEPVRWNPGEAVVIGPTRTRSRRVAAVARELLVGAADSVFGPLWLNWWGGYSLSVYMGPREFMTTERVEMTQLAAVFAPAATLLTDAAFAGLGTFSERAANFQKSHTSRWTQADWVHNDYSASEGYRRMISALLGDEVARQASLYDLSLEVRQSGLLPGRTLPLRMAQMPWQNAWRSVMVLGCLLTTALALVVATKLAWDATISHFARQAWRSLVSIVQLLMHSGDSLRHLWRQMRIASLFLLRYIVNKAGAFNNLLWRSIRSTISRDRAVNTRGATSPSRNATPSQDYDDTVHDAREETPPQQVPAAEPLPNDPFMRNGHVGIFGAILGHVASIYGCLHAFVFTMRFILVYLPFEPFMIAYALLQMLIQVDLANTEVLDRGETEA